MCGGRKAGMFSSVDLSEEREWPRSEDDMKTETNDVGDGKIFSARATASLPAWILSFSV